MDTELFLTTYNLDISDLYDEIKSNCISNGSGLLEKSTLYDFITFITNNTDISNYNNNAKILNELRENASEEYLDTHVGKIQEVMPNYTIEVDDVLPIYSKFDNI